MANDKMFSDLGIHAFNETMSMYAAAVPISSYPLGVDVSHWQGKMNWPKAKTAGVKFAMIKITEGATYVDDQAARNSANCKSLNIPYGFYHFVRPSVSSGQQMDNIVRAVEALPNKFGDFPLALDCEVNDGRSAAVCSRIIYDLSQRIQDRYAFIPMIYTSPSFANTYLIESPAYDWDAHKLWLANWRVDKPMVPKHWKNTGWYIWQFDQWDGPTYGAESEVIDVNRLAEQIAPPPTDPPSEMPAEITVAMSTTINGVSYSGRATLTKA